ncbi:Dentin sialoprotein [Actinidia chinensis var. chinensis]|uniref:Dentin sialoprotein n=1 Tax=Actinidia chinensis var. chinensis TaxID=1590841 RepID=A0A2R6R1M3_ACTCC|nr:Dentin sialoprotein [Actinidia chinensis var. chinensis]
MVQTKVPNKLGLQADQTKSITQKANIDPRKMKKSKPIKRSDFESSGTTSFRRGVPPQGKPPTMGVEPGAATPQKQFPTKGSEASPNYMKPTSRFEARRERSQVSSRSSKTSIMNVKSLIKTPNNSKALTRTSSLKLVRTLTKSPSFKPESASIKKCSQVVVCEDLNVQRATCSSTLKDSKFPTYIELSLGATESEGTSVMKVCPYTYCSLNGHRHAPLPPLKCFLATRRCILKTQKKTELACLSPHCAKPSAVGMEEMIIQEMTVDERAAVPEMDSNSSKISPLTQEDQVDFFIEIYVNNAEDAAKTTGGSKQNGENKDETCFSASEHSEAETTVKFELEETDSEISDMEWEEGQYSVQSLDGVGNSPQTNVAYNFKNGSFHAGDDNPCPYDQFIFKSDEIVSSNFDKISAEGPEEVFEEEGECSGAGCSNGGFDSEGSCQNLVSNESMHALNNQNYQMLPTCDVFEESTIEEKDGTVMSDDFEAAAIYLIATERPVEEPREAREYKNEVLEADEENPRNNLQLEDDETESTSNIKDEALIDCPENEFLEDYKESILPENQEHDSSQSFSKSHEDETYEDQNSSDNREVYQSDAVGKEVLDGSLLPDTEDSETNQSPKEGLSTDDDTDEVEKEQENATKSLVRIPTSDLLQGSPEAEEHKTEEDNYEIQCGATARDDESNQAFSSEGFAAETQVHSSNKQSQSNCMDEEQNQGSSEAEEDKTEEDDNEIQIGATARDDEPSQAFASEGFAAETQVHSSDKQPQSNSIDEDQNQGSCEAEEGKTEAEEDDNEIQISATARDDEPSQVFASEGFAAETQVHSSDKQPQSNSIDEDQNQGSCEAEEGKTEAEEDDNEIQISATARDDEPSQVFASEGFAAETQVHSSDKQSQSNRLDEDQNQGSSEAEEDKSETEEDDNEIQIGATARDDEPSQVFASEGFAAETQVHSSDKQSQSNRLDEDQNQGSSEAEEDKSEAEEDDNEIQLGATARDDESSQVFASEGFAAETQVHSSDKQSQSNSIDEDQNQSDKDCHENRSFEIGGSMDSEDQTHSGRNQVSVTQKANEDIEEVVLEYPNMSEPEESFPSAKNEASTQVKPAFCHGRGHSSQELHKAPNHLRIIKSKGYVEDLEDPRKFDPREPNYLSIEPDPEAEKVDLRHLSMEETKNEEEWMLDYAIRQAVTKLAPARKRKVALLVEAFEKVMPIPKYESHLSHTQAAFAPVRPIQTCS